MGVMTEFIEQEGDERRKDIRYIIILSIVFFLAIVIWLIILLCEKPEANRQKNIKGDEFFF